MFVLDTDHLSEIERGSRPGRDLVQRLSSLGPEVITTIVSAEEQCRGWLAHVGRLREAPRQVRAYARFQHSLENVARMRILPFGDDAAGRFTQMRKDGIRVGSMDLKIACIVMGHGATLLTRNATDFEQVPGLRHENWL